MKVSISIVNSVPATTIRRDHSIKCYGRSPWSRITTKVNIVNNVPATTIGPDYSAIALWARSRESSGNKVR